MKRRKNRWQRENEEKRIEEKHDTEENTVVRGNGGKGGKRISEVRTSERITRNVWKKRKSGFVKKKERRKRKKGGFEKGLKASGERRRRARRR